MTAAEEDVAAALERLRAEAAILDALNAVGRRLTAQLDIDAIVQEATDAATRATGAAFGAFFYNLVDANGESYMLYTLSGVPRAAFERFPMPRNTEVFAPTFDGAGTVRSDDITADRRFGRNEPYHGMPEGHLPVRSYLAVSAISPTSGEVLGGFFFGHPEPGRFTARHQHLVEGIAGYGAIALDNARLIARERNLATELARSVLPVVPEVPGLRVATRYLPAASGAKIGGDWYDVIGLPRGRTAFVIGDVVGHGVTAATIMAQVRTAIRSYALLDLPPGELLGNVSRLVEALFGLDFVTCFYAVHDPEDAGLTYANAGHLSAALVHPGGAVDQLGEALAAPLGVGREFPQERVALPPDSDLVLYTDGLVESRSRDITLGIDTMLAALPRLRAVGDVEAVCDDLVATCTDGRHDDDIAIVLVRRGADALHRRLGARPEALPALRAETAAWLTRLGLDEERCEDVVLAVNEAVSNCIEHAYRDVAGTVEVDATCADGWLTITVVDHGRWKPRDGADPYRGRGLEVIAAVADAAETTHRDDGTTVTIRFALR